jgi:hypothetical protein
MTGRSTLQRALTVAVAVLMTVVVSDALTFAATGSSLILGKLNKASATTTIQNTGAGSAVKLVTKSTATPPMVVNGKGKVTNLYADRAAKADNATKLGGRTPAQIAATMKGPKGDPGAAGKNGATGPAGPAGPAFGRVLIGVKTVDGSAGLGADNSIAIGIDGNPVIAYYDAANLRVMVAKCVEIDCSGPVSAHTIYTTTSGFLNLSMTIAPDGNPVVAMVASITNQLVVARCHDSGCVAGTTTAVAVEPNQAHEIDVVEGPPSIAIGLDGNPIIAYYDSASLHAKVAQCSDLACSGSITLSTIDESSTDDDGKNPSITIRADGTPVIAYAKTLAGVTGARPVVATCTNNDCANAVVHTIDTAQWSGFHPSLAIGIDGNPVVAYYDATVGKPALATCVDATCAGAPTKVFLDASSPSGDFPSLAIGPDGNPIVTYVVQSNGQLRVALCATRTCTTPVTNKLIDTHLGVESLNSIVLGADGSPVIAYFASSTDGVRVAKLARSSWTPNGWGR